MHGSVTRNFCPSMSDTVTPSTVWFIWHTGWPRKTRSENTDKRIFFEQVKYSVYSEIYENRLIRERIYSHTHLCPIFRQFFGWFVASRQQTFFPKILSLTVYIVIYIHFKHLFRICIFSAMLATVMLSLIYFVFTATQIIQNFQHDTTFMSA